MKFSELWLREWVNPAIDSEALSDQITMAGLEEMALSRSPAASTASLSVKWWSAVSTRTPINCASPKSTSAANACWTSSAARQTAVRG